MNRNLAPWVPSLGVLLLAPVLALQGTAGPARSELEEPPLEFVLELDGRRIPMTAGAPVPIKIGEKEYTARLSIEPDRLFKARELSFRIPRQHAFEADASTPGQTQWTFDGGASTLILTRFEGQAAPEDVVTSSVKILTARYGKKNTRTVRSTIDLGGTAHPATRLTSRVLGESMAHEIAAFAAGERMFLLMLQYTPGEDGSPADEAASVLSLLARTFALEAPPEKKE